MISEVDKSESILINTLRKEKSKWITNTGNEMGDIRTRGQQKNDKGKNNSVLIDENSLEDTNHQSSLKKSTTNPVTIKKIKQFQW